MHKRKILPIYVIWGNKVSREVVREVINGIKRLFRKIGVYNPKIILGGTFENSNTEYFLNGKAQKIINVSSLETTPYGFCHAPLAAIEINRSKKDNLPFYYVMIIGKRAFAFQPYEPYFSEVGGFASSGIGCIISTFDIMKNIPKSIQIKDNAFVRKMIRRRAAHEFGHVLGLTTGKHQDKRGFYFIRHCGNICVMSQSLLGDIKKYQEEEKRKVFLCRDCIEELKEGLDIQEYFRKGGD